MPDGISRDLSAAYRRDGLRGVIPFAFRQQKEGSDFLVRHVLDGDPLWMVCSPGLDIPRLTMEDRGPVVYVFTKKHLAEEYCASSPQTAICQVSLVEGQRERRSFLELLLELGVYGLRFDQAVFVTLARLLPDRVPQMMARERILSSAVTFLSQKVAENASCTNLLKFVRALLSSGSLLLPAFVDPAAVGTIREEDVFFPAFRCEEDREVFLAFTSEDLYQRFLNTGDGWTQSFPQRAYYPAGLPLLRALLQKGNGPDLLVNPGTASLVMERGILLQESGEVAIVSPRSVLPPEEDPMPDFLRGI